MRATSWWPVLAFLAVSGCSTKYQAVTPELQATFLADLQAGKLNLDCGEGCALTWGQRAATIHAVDLGERWQELATDVMQIGFGSDLAYYYLGQAAQGLGYHQAAIAYYSQSLALATGQNPLVKCTPGALQVQAGSDPCQGVNLVSDIPVLVQASRDAIAQQQQADAAAQAAQSAPPPVHHHHRRPPASTPTGSTATATAAPTQPDAAASAPAAASGTAATPAAPQPGLLLPPPPSQ